MRDDQNDNEIATDIAYRGSVSSNYSYLAVLYSPKVFSALQNCGLGWHSSKEIEGKFPIDIPLGEEKYRHYYYLVGLRTLLNSKKIERRIRREGCLSPRFINEYRLISGRTS